MSGLITAYSKTQADIEPALKPIREQIEEKKRLLEAAKPAGKMSKILLLQKEINKLSKEKEEVRKPVDVQREKIKQLKEEIGSMRKEVEELKRIS